MSTVDVLVPTYRRPAALAATLATVAGQTVPEMRVVVSDQTEAPEVGVGDEACAVLRFLEARGHRVEVHQGRPRRGVAEQRQFLLSRARARYALFLDDDVLIEADLVARLLRAIGSQGCGFVGSALIGLSYVCDERPAEQEIELWEDRVQPEALDPSMPEWDRHRLHSAANLWHVQRRLGISPEDQRVYKVAWVGGCVLYDVDKLRGAGGFEFWEELPLHSAGEDVVAQLRVMARFGGCGVIPSGAYHQELPTTLPVREVDAPYVLSPQA